MRQNTTNVDAVVHSLWFPSPEKGVPTINHLCRLYSRYLSAQGTRADTYPEWKARVFTEAEQADPTISGETALSAAGDGIPNILKYAFGIDPHIDGSLALPKISTVEVADPSTGVTTRYPVLSYQTPSANPVSDLYFVPEASIDLQTWVRGDAIFDSPSTENGGDAATISIRTLSPLSTTSTFLRLRVIEGQILPDDWQQTHFGSTGIDPNDDPDGDGKTNFDEFLHGTDPNDYYEGRIPTLQVVSGNGQRGFPSRFLPFPVLVRVSYQGTPLANAPVHVSVTAGGAQISATSSPPSSASLDQRADSNGLVTIYVQLGAAQHELSRISATAANQTKDVTETSLGAISSKVAAGDNHSLAIDPNGAVWVWGDNSNGQLGDGTYNSRNAPFQNPALGNVVDIAGGEYHSVAVEADGTVWAWVLNWNGQLGDSTTDDHLFPNQVPSFIGAIAACAGAYHTIALRADGTVWAWGSNSEGQLGNGTTNDSLVPVQVVTESGAALTQVIGIAAGYYHNLAVEADGTVWAWGGNGDGELGDGTYDDHHAAVQVVGLTNATLVRAGAYHSIALISDASGSAAPKRGATTIADPDSSTVWAWGADFLAQLGNNNYEDSAVPIPVGSLAGIVDLSAGWAHCLALSSDGTVIGWGSDGSGEATGDSNGPVESPTLVAGLSSIVSIAAGDSHSLGYSSNNLIYSWGGNGDGQLGRASDQYASPPTPTDKDTNHVGLPDWWQLQVLRLSRRGSKCRP